MNKQLMLASAAVLALTVGMVRAASQMPAATPNSVTSSTPAAPQAPAGILAKGEAAGQEANEPAGQEQAEANEPAGQEQAEANEPAGQDTDNVQDGDQSGADGGVEAPEAPGK